MNTETRNFLLECKKVGYAWISIGIKDKRVPSSTKIEWYGEQKYHTEDGGLVPPSIGWYTGGIPRKNLDGKRMEWVVPPHVVCGEPPVLDGTRPAIWGICENSTLTSGLWFRGMGNGETHMIRQDHPLDLGVYDLSEIS